MVKPKERNLGRTWDGCVDMGDYGSVVCSQWACTGSPSQDPQARVAEAKFWELAGGDCSRSQQFRTCSHIPSTPALADGRS